MKGKINYRALLGVIQNNQELSQLVSEGLEMPLALVYTLTVGGKSDDDTTEYLDWVYNDKVAKDEKLLEAYKSNEQLLAQNV